MKKKQTAQQPSKQPKTQAQLTEQRLRFYPLLLGILALAVAFVYIVCQENFFLWRVQELNLFLYTPLFLKQQMVVAGGLLVWLGTYFTQFFYHVWLGTLLLCLWCALLMWLTYHAFSIPRRWAALLLIPLALVLLTDFTIGYWIFQLKLRGHFFIAVIGTSAAVALLWLFRTLPTMRGLRLAFMVLTTIACYPLMGFYALLATALMGLVSWRLSDMKLTQKIIATALALALIVFVPLIYYRYVFCQAAIENIWRQALPLFDNGEPYYRYYWPIGLLFAFYVVMALAYRKPSEGNGLLARPRIWASLQAAIVAIVAGGCCYFWYSDANFHKELRMEAALEQLDWEEVLRQSAANPEPPTRLMWMYKNLAVFKLGRAGDEMYNYREGDAKPNCAFISPMVVQGGKRFYMEYGLVNYCYRWCTEDGVEYGWRVDYLKYQVLCSLLNGEYVLARKFLDVLRQTRYYAEWADHYYTYLNHPDAIKNDPRLGPITHLMRYQNMLASDKSVIETFLLSTLSTTRTSDPVLADLVAVSALQQKDIPTFWNAFQQYILTHPNQRVPRHFQEAAFMFGNLERKVDISKMPFDPSIPESFRQFMQAAQKLRGMNEKQMAEVLYSRFGNTYFFDYFLMRGLQTY